MKKLLLAESDIHETPEISHLIKRLDSMDSQYVDMVTDDIQRYQPFFLNVLLGYREDVTLEELEEIMKVYFLIWEYLAPKGKLQKKIVDQACFEGMQRNNMHMLHYSEGEPENSKEEIYTQEFQSLSSKSLWTAILHRFKDRTVLADMGTESRGANLIGILSFIQCFEKI